MMLLATHMKLLLNFSRFFTVLQVAVNNDHFIAFRSRTPNLQSIQWVEVESDATVSSIFVQ